MQKNSKIQKENKLISHLSNLYEMYEAYSINSILVRCIDIFYCFLQMTGYVYYFGLEMEPGVGRYYVYLNYYSDPFILSHIFKFQKFAISIFFLFIVINAAVASSFCFRFFKSNKRQFGSYRKLNSLEILISCMSEIYLSCLIVESIEVFLIGFRDDEEIIYIYDNLSENMHAFLKICGAAGIATSCILGIPFIFFNQDYKFLDQSKVRMQVNIKFIFSFLLRIIENIFFNVFPYEWIHFAINYFFLLILGANYLETFPLRNRTISVFYISNIIYSISNISIFSLFRLELLLGSDDLVPLNILFLIFSFILGSKIYDNLYWKNLISEEKKKKVSIFTLEEIVLLYSSFKKQLEINFLIAGYFRFHKKNCSNVNCLAKKIQLPNSLQDNELRKEYIMEFIFSNFKELIEDNKAQKIDNKLYEVIIAKYMSFFLNYGFNPVRNFYEVQKTLNQKKILESSLYFKIFANSLNKDLKKNAKIYLNQKKFDEGDLKQKNTYDEFFKILEEKKKIENDFRKLLIQKINFFEKISNGLRSLGELFILNIKFAPMVIEFKNALQNLSNTSHFSKLLKYKFSYFLNILILNHYSDAILDEQNLREYFKSKTDDLIDKDFMYKFFKDSTVVCEVSFLSDINGKIQEKCKTQRFLKFFGYSKDDGQKVSFLSDILPPFLRNTHHTYIKNFLQQNRKDKVTEIEGHTIDKDGFVFPIKLSVALRYNYLDDFVMVGALVKQNLNFEKFCILDLEGNILNISSRFFADLKNNYETLNIEDIKYINIFNLIENSKELFKINNDSFAYQEGKSFINFPKKLFEFIQKTKLKERENDDFSKYKETNASKSTKSKTKIHTDFNDSFSPEKTWKKAEIIYNWSQKRIGQNDYQINIIILNIMKFKQIDMVEINRLSLSPNEFSIINPENILNSFSDCKDEHPKFINFLANDSKVFDHFGKFKIQYQEAPKKYIKTFDKLEKKENSNTQQVFQDEEYLNSDKFDKFSSQIKNSDVINISNIQSSTSSEYKSELRVSLTIKDIEKMTPKPIKISLLLILAQTFVLILYTSLYKIIIINYIDNYFKPNKNSLFSFCQQYYFTGLMLLSNNKIEYMYLNMLDLNERPEYKAYLNKIYNVSVRNTKIINDQKRNTMEDSTFTNNYKELIVTYVDTYSMKFIDVSYIEFQDIIVSNINGNIPYILNFDFDAINYDQLIFLCRNFPNYLSTSAKIYKNLANEYLGSNDILNAQILNILIIFLVLYIFFKIWEIYSWIKFISILKKLFIIFLRVNDDDIMKELENSKEFLQLMKESNSSDNYYHMNMFDLMKREKIKNSTNNSNIKKAKNKMFFSRFKNFPKLSLVVYLLICFGISSLFFSVNFFNSSLILNFLGRSIDIDVAFSNTYLYSASSIYLEDLLLREKIIVNPGYELLNDSLQTKNGRINFFSVLLSERIKIIGNSSASNLIIEGFETSKSIKDVNTILSGNLCEIFGKELNNEEKATCEQLLNGAFKNGIGNAISEFVKNIKSREQTLQYLTNNTNEDLMQQEAIKRYIRSLEYFEVYLVDFYLHDFLEKFSNLNDLFYADLLEKKQLNFSTFLYISLVCFVLFNVVILYMLKTKIQRIYNYSCLILSFIPYERLTKDEQILNFLKKFLKSNE